MRTEQELKEELVNYEDLLKFYKSITGGIIDHRKIISTLETQVVTLRWVLSNPGETLETDF